MESPPSPPNPTTPSPWRRTRHWKWIIWWHHPGCCIARRYPDRFTASIRAPDKDGVRIAELNEESFRYLLWDHKPLTDFWQTGPGTVRRLKSLGIHTMGELARFSLTRQDMLYDRFGVDAEILIDHAWGLEPCTMQEIKAYRPSSASISEGQVLKEPYTNAKARIIVQEMAENLSNQLLGKKLSTDGLVLTICLLLCDFQFAQLIVHYPS